MCVCLSVGLSVALSAIIILLYTPQFWSDCSTTSHTCWMWSPHCVQLFSVRSKVKVVNHPKVKNVFLVISRRRIVVESRDWYRTPLLKMRRKWEESHFKCTTYIQWICGLRDFAIPRTALVPWWDGVEIGCSENRFANFNHVMRLTYDVGVSGATR